MTKKAKYDEIVQCQDEIYFTCRICGRKQYDSEYKPSLFCTLCGRMACSRCHQADAGECNECAGFGLMAVPTVTDA